ncbi:TonB-dependent receptor [Rubrivirga sp.]|uniref:TonB-dependent receptor n=1 Tax=Rubrivirga sp. TaxID=1885344 RepID=UPI003B528450
MTVSHALSRSVGLCALIAVLWVPAALAQTGKVSGRIVDAATQEPLIGVAVVVGETGRGAATNVDGYYDIVGVRPGTYDLRASYVGYAPQTVEGVRVRIDQTTTIDLSLAEESVQGEEVVVQATRPIVQRDRTSSESSVSAEDLEALPVQSFQDVVNLQAGVVEGHFRGGRVGEVAYLVDGVPVNDVYDQSFAFQVENQAIQEVQVISGTFNAEYGQAQSGVVNIVTKDGGTEYRASLSAYGGDYGTSRDDLFERPRSFSPLGNVEANGSLGGPVPGLGDRLTFFASGRAVRNDGYLYGRQVVTPTYASTGERVPVQVDDRTVFVPGLGDSTLASLNWSEQTTAQLKLTAQVPGGRLALNGLVQRDRGQNYDPLFRYNPAGQTTVYGASESIIGTYTALLSATTFVDVKGAVFANAVDEYVYEDPLDPRYPNDAALRELAPNFSFYLGGVRNAYFTRDTRTAVGRVDVTSQLTRAHLVKGGVEVKAHTLGLDRFDIRNNASTGFEPAIPEAGTPAHVSYEERPIEASAYLQDKIELDYFVVNLGVRLDYFDARTSVPSDFTRPTTGERVATDVKVQLSPRLGFAYPISEQGVVHVAYGHFFQMPPFDFLFTNPDYVYSPEAGLGRAFGYADLEPQKTVAYEIGLQQGITSNTGLNLTVYYKDIRNLLGTRIERIAPGVGENFQLSYYGRYTNRDYGNVRGVTLAFERRAGRGAAGRAGLGLNVDYTYQIAEGNASNPRDVLLLEGANDGRTQPTQLSPLDWDRRHQLNVRVAVGEADRSYGLVSLVGRLGSGLPYTPTRADERTGVENSARRPGVASVDLFATRQVRIGGLRPGLFLRVYNLFDADNLTNVYTDTGRAEPNLRFYSGQPLGLNTREEFLLRPDFYSAPRQIQFGVSVDL